MEFTLNSWNLRFDFGALRNIAQATNGDPIVNPFGEVNDSFRKAALILWSGRIRFAKMHKQTIPTETVEDYENELENLSANDIVKIIRFYNEGNKVEDDGTDHASTNGQPTEEEKKSIATEI